MTPSQHPRLPPLCLVLSLLSSGSLANPMRVDPQLRRRGEGSNPYTDDPSTAPTTPPSSSYNHGVPTIDGSEGGFIGLIVGLGVLVIACSLTVFFLLKNRRSRRTKSSTTPGGGGLGASYDAKTSFPKPGQTLFGGSKQKKGWLKTGDGGEYEPDGGIELSGGRREAGPYLSSDASGAFSSASTVRLAPPGSGNGPYGEAYSPSPSVENLVSPQTGDRTPTSGMEMERDRGEMYRSVEGGQGAEDTSPTSAMSRPSFEGGTRFRESF